ncbi:MAG: cyclic nucleotide-binding domain-containing protein [Hyphomicrobiales bacterium]|nr:cyclic nucleotide-binding domain-containing protein [Hyphomicrobiales bacterium]
MALDTDIEILRTIPLFAALSPDALRLLVFSSEKSMVADGNTICGNAPLDGALVVMSGAASIAAPRGSLRPAQDFVAPLLLGATSLVVADAQVPRATAVGKVGLMRISRALFRRILDEYPDDAMKLRDALTADLASFTGDLARHARN